MVVAAGLAATPAAAQDKPLWELGVGGYALALPDYRGADEGRGYLVPFPYIKYRGKHLRVDEEGGHLGLFSSERLDLDLSLSAGPPADSEDNEARAGMPDLDPTVEIGPELEVLLRQDRRRGRTWTLVLPIRAVVATDLSSAETIGWVAAPHLKWEFEGRWDTSVSVGPLFAGERNHDYFYEVEPAFATARRPAYDAEGGYSGSRITVFTSRRHGRLWMGGFVRYDYLGGAAFADSPLVKTDHSLMAGFGVAWIIGRSNRTAPARREP